MTIEFTSAPSAEHALTHDVPSSVPSRATDADDVTIALDDGSCVGHVESSRADLTVPGAVRLTAALITGLSVAETHRRQGVLTGMLDHLLNEAHDRGQVLATISSPHSWLHPRLGFGVASEAAAIEVDARRARPVHRPGDGRVEVLDASSALDEVIDVYDRCVRERTGTVSRTAEEWKRRLAPPRGAESPVRSEVAVQQDSGGRPVGYAHYDVPGDDHAVGVIREMWGETPAVERALWDHLLTIDTVATWRSAHRPHDDPIRHALADLRAVRTTQVVDETWLRLLDVDVALGARTYNASTRTLTVRVRDPIVSANNGTWRVDSYGSFRSQGAPDVEVDVSVLSAVYLGGTSWRDLADAGRVVVHRDDAPADGDTLFAARPAPFRGPGA